MDHLKRVKDFVFDDEEVDMVEDEEVDYSTENLGGSSRSSSWNPPGTTINA